MTITINVAQMLMDVTARGVMRTFTPYPRGAYALEPPQMQEYGMQASLIGTPPRYRAPPPAHG